MSKKRSQAQKVVKNKADRPFEFFLKDLNGLSRIPVFKKHQTLVANEFPFDEQLLGLSRLYRFSRESYYQIGGQLVPSLCSTMRALSAQDLFADRIEYSPAMSEILWFRDHLADVSDPELEFESISHFNQLSLFHEQNHRLIWRLLPPAPTEERDLSRYLNFAESLVVTLDMALGDELGAQLSPIFERMKVIYRSGGRQSGSVQSRKIYRQYLLALLVATYYLLEMINEEDILKAVNFVLPGQKKINQQAVRRSLELSELFSRVTNPQWQERYWQQASAKLVSMHKKSNLDPLYLPEDPLDLEEELVLARQIFSVFGL